MYIYIYIYIPVGFYIVLKNAYNFFKKKNSLINPKITCVKS